MQLAVGRIGRAHGVRGEVLVEVRTDDPDRRFAAGSRLDSEHGILTVRRSRWHQGRLIVAFAEVPDRNAAEALHGATLAIDSSALEPMADPDEYHDHELLDLTVVTVGGVKVGVVADVIHPGQDVLVVHRDDGRETLVPFVADLVPTVDLRDRRVVIDPPPGLLEL